MDEDDADNDDDDADDDNDHKNDSYTAAGAAPGVLRNLLGRPGWNRNFIKNSFWTRTRPCTSCFQAAHGTPIFKKSIF